MTGRGCPFCNVAADGVIHAGKLVLAVWDGFPVSPGHALIVPKRHVASWFEATPEERRELIDAVEEVRGIILESRSPSGFNVGWNDGQTAGQTIFHLHIHVIPRYPGDVADPRGGVRHVIPAKAAYWIGATPTPAAGTSPDQALIRGETDPFLPHLRAQLDRSTAVDVAVAFVMLSGLEPLLEHIEDLLHRGGRARIVTGDYMDATDPLALQRLLDLTFENDFAERLQLRVFETAPGATFHPKAYLFHGARGPATAYVGSSNLTGPALGHGLEWNYRILFSRDRAGLEEVASAFEALLRHPNTRPLTQEWIDEYRARRSPAARRLEVPIEPPPPPPEPHAIQAAALAALEKTRAEGNSAGLVVLATGLGKTWLSAFDSHREEFRRILFIAHRDEILTQALQTYRRIRPLAHLGKYNGTEKVPEADVLFASIQTLGRRTHLRNFERNRFDYVVVDEFHHAAAATYRRLIEHFTPKFLLGLTATPERTDGGDLLGLCRENLVFRCDLFEGIREDHLCPFHYFGVRDDVDYQQIPWRSTRFDEEALTQAVATQRRAENALEQWRRLGGPGSRTLGFCCSMRHADFMAAFFRERGIRAVAVHSGPGSAPRSSSLEQLQAGELDIVFAVDMFNEGVDLPRVDTILMLRPTESRILWLQQFGRGLRKAEGKAHLTVVDYIGNHKVFLMKPQALFGIGSDRRDLARLLERYEREEVELPPGCEVTYELEAVKILREQIGPALSAPEALRTFYQDFKEREGRRPTATEAFHEGYAPRAVRQAFGSWLEFVNDQGDLSPEAAEARTAAAGFLRSLETTEMTRSYKMLLLLAMLNRDAFPGSIGIEDLAEEFALVAGRSARTRQDVSVPLDDRAALRTLIEDNPVEAWVGGRGTGGTPYFAFENGRLRFLPAIPDEVRPAFQELVRELVDWRMADYLRRAAAPTGEDTFEAKVIHSGPNPILKLPDRETKPNLPVGWTPLEVDGQGYEGNFVKIALNVVRKEGEEENQLPEILYGWFGPDAGKPGTNYWVLFEKAESGWRARPRGGGGKGSGLVVGRSYRRQDVAEALGASFGGRNWQTGLVFVDHHMLLFVTLDKQGVAERYEYKDKFLSRDVFQWQSQNQTTQKGSVGQKIRDHRSRGLDVYLFVRKEAKTDGRTNPFFYCGELEFLEWEGEKPITVKWRLKATLNSPLSAHLLRT